MPRQEHILTVFVASPGDVADERARLEEVIRELNQAGARELGIRLELVRWETHAYPGVGDDPQDVINKQIPDDYDVFIGIMWCRYGAATKRAGSGTVEEFERARRRFEDNNSSVKLMFYFKDDPVPPSELDLEQMGNVAGFRNQLGNEGTLYWKCVGVDAFEKLVRLHLTRQLHAWKKQLGESENKLPAVAPAPPIQDDVVDTDDDNEDFGVLDVADIFEEQFADLTDIATRIASATEDLGNKMTQQSADMNALPRDVNGSVDRKIAKKYIARAASDMDKFSDRLEAELPLFNDAMNTGMNAFIRTVEMSAEIDRGQDDVDQGREALTAIVELQGTLETSRDFQVSFRESIASLPRMTSVLNRSKRRALTAVDRFIAEFDGAQTLLAEAEKTVREFIDQREQEIGT
jgi:hypothetical protein